MEQNQSSNNIQSRYNFLTTLLSVLLLLSSLIAGFFAYQTQKLVKELNTVKINDEPIATQTPIVDPTLNWRSYTNLELSYSFKLSPVFKYPEKIVPSESNSFSTREEVNSPLELSTEDILLESTVYTNIDDSSLQKVKTALSSQIQDVSKQPFQPIGSIKKLQT
jgi:hypothetical protein